MLDGGEPPGWTTRAARVLAIAGTRPEAIKIAPLLLAARERPGLQLRLLATGQHGALFDEALAGFGLGADRRLNPPPAEPDPDRAVADLVDALLPLLPAEAPDLVLVQGDTSSAYAGALAAHRLGIAVGHVEAGLRSFDLAQPFPEERNRVAIDRLATLLFAPTDQAAANLAADPFVTGQVRVTGNSGIDALMGTLARLPAPACEPADARALILLTCHRRENIGAGLEGICIAARHLADRGDVRLLCPLHGNPAVRRIVEWRLGAHPAIALTAPLSYPQAIAAMAGSRLILTDSGGIQEEAPALGVPTLVLRNTTERPEGVAAGHLRLVGTDPARIVAEATRLLDDPAAHAAMARPGHPFGRGDAAPKILDQLEHYFSQTLAHDHRLRSAPDWTKHAPR